MRFQWPCWLALLMATACAIPVAVAPSENVTFSLVLTRQRPRALADAVDAVSRISSPRYRQYLSDSEIAALLVPTNREAVEEWVYVDAPDASIVRQAHGSGQVLEITAPAAQVAALFRVTLARFGSLVRAADQSSPRPPLPDRVAPHIAAVIGVFELPPRASTRPSWPQAPAHDGGSDALSCDFKGDLIDPNVLAKQYEWPAAHGAGADTSHVSQGVAAFEDAQFNPSDVTAFEAAYHLPNVTLSVKGPNDGGFFGEAGLDTQYIVASGPGIPSWFLSQRAFDLATWCEMVLTVQPLPTVWSVSWGGGESNYAVDAQHAADDCFARAALKGVTVLAASGDDGTGSHGGILGCKAFDPTYPASCPHVTSVGATYLASSVEHAWSFSGGGFSDIFERPSWQDAAAAGYVQNAGAALPSAALYNASGRVTPDVSALGTCYTVFSGGAAVGTLSGTSAATPTFAGMISRINDALVAAGKPTVGFINPTLYSAGGSVGTDITSGNNKKRACKAGFPAIVGFDAVTGLGTPLWNKLYSLLAGP